MENYTRFFPSSSSSSSTLSSSTINPNFSLFGGNSNINSSGGFLGLISEMEVPRSGGEMSMVSDVEKMSNGSENHSDGKKKSLEKKKMKKPRYAFQTRSQVDILDDGYRWRKYGQKAVKNNKYPRSYYRCTHQGCNVKKQVQRLTKDEGVVVTTYEGVHSHSIEKSTDNFEHILSQMQIYTSY